MNIKELQQAEKELHYKVSELNALIRRIVDDGAHVEVNCLTTLKMENGDRETPLLTAWMRISPSELD